MSHIPHKAPPPEEFPQRIQRLTARLSQTMPEWDTVWITGRINLYYLTGTMQDSVFVLRKEGGSVLFVRRSYERAEAESPLTDIRPMHSFREIAQWLGGKAGRLLMETELIPLAYLNRMGKHITYDSITSVESHMSALRAVKSPYELERMEVSGQAHHRVLTEILPELLREGMSECDLLAALFPRMLALGFQGVTRFGMFQNETLLGQYGFGENTLYPTSFDGPGGMKGRSPALAHIGSEQRRLQRGDLVFVDVGFGADGYHTDKTQVYAFGQAPSDQAKAAHKGCMDILAKAAALLRPGVKPSEVYAAAVPLKDTQFMENFMGFGQRTVRFLGHGIGLVVDEWPVIAPGFDTPLEEGMTIALEPKKGIADQGMVGVEETYRVTPKGGQCLTGGPREIIEV